MQEADRGDGYEVIFYGDSLTEMWRGTRSDQPYPPRTHARSLHLTWHLLYQVGISSTSFTAISTRKSKRAAAASCADS